jgi:hypothetical protein
MTPYTLQMAPELDLLRRTRRGCQETEVTVPPGFDPGKRTGNPLPFNHPPDPREEPGVPKEGPCGGGVKLLVDPVHYLQKNDPPIKNTAPFREALSAHSLGWFVFKIVFFGFIIRKGGHRQKERIGPPWGKSPGRLQGPKT